MKITVDPVNDPPTAYNLSIETAKNTAVSGTLAGYDPDGDALTYSYSGETNGTVSAFNTSDGTFTFTPTTDFTGTASFSYSVTDGHLTAAATVTINVYGSGGGGAYTVSDISDTSTPEDTTKTITVNTTMSSATLTATSSNTDLLANSGITITNKGGGSFDIAMSPNPNCTGRTVITVVISNGTYSYSKTFVLTVTPVDDAPVSYDKSITIDENKYVYDFVTATDIDDSSVIYFHSTPLHGTLTFNADGTFKYQPDLNWHGDDTFTFNATDSSSKSSSGTVTIHMIEVIKSGYNNNTRVSDVSFIKSESGVITEDFYMANFVLTLTAKPTGILGDGVATTELTATVTDSSGKPINGVKLSFSASKVNFSDTATTNSNGQATVTLTSTKLQGTIQQIIPIIVSVNDPFKNLYGSAWLKEYFVPGFVQGVVRDGITNNPIEGATVTVYRDLADGTHFRSIQKTDATGNYKIAVPEGNAQYNITITKPVKDGSTSPNVTFDQAVSVGKISGSGSSTETYNPDISASGVVMLAKTDGTDSIVTDFSANSGMSLQILDKDGIATDILPNSTTGVFSAGGLKVVATYTIQVVHKFYDGRKIVVGTSTITISDSGEMNISEILIDPYGTITDSSTGAVIKDATVKLYYANTARNQTAGITPDTVVSLPKVDNFPPSDNANSQQSDSNGYYAFSVYPDTDYYIVAAKPGYDSYKSTTISVGSSIVNWDFKMNQTIIVVSGSGSGSGSSADGNDLSIGLYSENMKVEEGSSVKLTAKYKNESDSTLSDYKISVTIPDGMSVTDAGGGTVSGNKITWSGTNLVSGKLESVSFTLKASQISEKENIVTVASVITSTQTLVNTADDSSSIKLMIYSNRFEAERKRYIKGYPDETFGPSRDMTRAETAAIFARLLDLDVSKRTAAYSDVTDDNWAAGYIAAVTNAGMMKGYSDGTFGSNNEITRAEFTTIIARYFSIERANSGKLMETNFSDISSSWAHSTIEEVYRYSIINGYTDGTFKPNSLILRSEAVTMLNRMLYRGPLSTEKLLFTDVGNADWFYGQVMQASMSFGYAVNSDGSESATQFIDDTPK